MFRLFEELRAQCSILFHLKFYSMAGGVGNLVQIRSTLFTGNRGYTGGPGDYGAAVALSLLNPLVERSNFPRHEITDW